MTTWFLVLHLCGTAADRELFPLAALPLFSWAPFIPSDEVEPCQLVLSFFHGLINSAV